MTGAPDVLDELRLRTSDPNRRRASRPTGRCRARHFRPRRNGCHSVSQASTSMAAARLHQRMLRHRRKARCRMRWLESGRARMRASVLRFSAEPVAGPGGARRHLEAAGVAQDRRGDMGIDAAQAAQHVPGRLLADVEIGIAGDTRPALGRDRDTGDEPHGDEIEEQIDFLLQKRQFLRDRR